MSKRVIVTGAASGIGAGTVAKLRAEGARVVGLDVNTAADPELIECDVTDQDAVEGAVEEAIERLGGGLDVLVNNAGIGTSQSAGRPPDERAIATFEVNLIAPWRVTSAAIEALRESRGRVVNVASGLAHLTVPLAPAYCMTKRGIVAYSDALRLEFGGEIDVTTVYPGYIKTPIHAESEADGFALDGIVPEESLDDAVSTMVRAVLGRPVRDIATTRRGGLGYTLLRGVPSRVKDRATLGVLRHHARSGRFDRSAVARELVGRLRTR